MMAVQFYMSDKNLAEFFNNAGFDTEIKTVTDYVRAYHNKTQEIKIDKLHVNVNGKLKPADEAYRDIMTRRMLMPDPTTIEIANEILNND